MVKVVACIVAVLALGQAAAASKAVSSFSEWVDGILADPNGDNMTPDEVMLAYKSGNFSAPPASESIFEALSRA